MEFTAKQISDLVSGIIEGDPDVTIHKVSKIEEGEPGSISFLSNPVYTHYIYTTEASVVIVNKSFLPTLFFRIQINIFIYLYEKIISFASYFQINIK